MDLTLNVALFPLFQLVPGERMVPLCRANCSVFTPEGKSDTGSLNKWWLDRGCKGRCMLLDPSCGFAVTAEFKHRFK